MNESVTVSAQARQVVERHIVEVAVLNVVNF